MGSNNMPKSNRLLSLAVVALTLFACQEPPRDAQPVLPSASRADPLFIDGDFESGAFAPNWLKSTYQNFGLAVATWPPATVANLQLSAGGIDTTTIGFNAVPQSQPPAGLVAAPGVPLWPKFGQRTPVVNALGNNNNVNMIRQSYVTTNADVDPSDGKIHVRWVLAPVLENPNHAQQQQPYFFVLLRNLTRAIDLYSTFNFSNSPGTPWQAQGTTLFTDWTIFDIAPGNVNLQVGDNIEIQVYAAGCSLGGHWGEVYVDGFGSTFPGLSVVKSAPAQTNVDSDLTYTFVVRNNTSGLAPNVVADEVLPPDTTFVSYSSPDGTCTHPAVGATGTVSCNFGWMNPGATATFQVTVHAYTPLSKGTASAGGASTLSDATMTWGVNAWRGYSLYITGGTGAGQVRFIGSNTATQLTVSTAWTAQPDATSTYAIVVPPLTQGVASAANATRLDDSSKAWVTNQWSGATVSIVAGTGVGQSRRISSNTATRLNITPNWVTTPNTTSVYAVKLDPKVSNGNYGVAGDTIARLLGPRVETAITGGIAYTDLALTKTDGVPGVAWGSPVQYTITVVNNGPTAVLNAVVADTLPAQLQAGATWTCAGSSGGSCDTASGVGNLNHTVDLPVGGVATFTINGTVIAGAGSGTLSNTASVTPPAGVIDNVPGNNADIDVDGIGSLFALTVTKGAGTGQGSVVSAPAAISCGNACGSASANFLSGTSVTLSAVARPGDTFTGWSGACAGTAVTCTVTVSAVTDVTASFTGPSITASTPAGNGSVTCVPANVTQGASSVCTVTANAGYGVASLVDNGVDVTASIAGGTYTLTNITTSHTIVATFGALPLTPTITAPTAGTVTNDPRPIISGTTSASVTVDVRVDGVVVCTTVSSAAGAFSCTPAADLADGPRVLSATATNSNGTTPASASVSITVDTVAPAAPVVTAPANGGSTNDTTPSYSGTAEANSTVTVRVDGVVVGSTTASGAGAWTFTPVAALGAGSHTVNATATDAAGNVSANSGTNTFTVDTVAPAAPVVTTPTNGSSTNDTTPTYSGTAEANSTVTVRVDGVVVGSTTASGAGAWTFTPVAALGAGSHTVNASATDAAGNTSANSGTNTFTVDTVAPGAPNVTAPANAGSTNDTTPTYSGTAEANSTVTVRVDGVVVGSTTANGAGAWTFTPVAALAAGSHTVNASATDAAGNTSANSGTNTFTVDTVAPAAPVVTAPANGGSSNDTTPTYSGTAEANSTVTVRVDGVVVGSTTADGTGAWTFTPVAALAAGSHTVNATATDAAGNLSASSSTNTFTVDTLAPAAPVVTAPTNGSSTNDTTPTYSGTAEPNSTVAVTVDGVVVGSTPASGAGAWTFTPVAALAAGSHTVNATATDAAGNVSASSSTNTFTVDTLAPAAPVVTAPTNGSSTNDTTPTYSGTAEANSTVAVTVDGVVVGSTTADGTGAWAFTVVTPLAEGAHTVNTTATDAAGNVSSTSNTNTFIVDTATPAAPVVTAPANGGSTNDPTPTYSGTAEPNSTVTVQVDGVVVGTATADGSGAWTFTVVTPLADGAHTVNTTATDAAGNVSSTSNTNTFTVDTATPTAPVVTAPTNGSSTNDPTPTYSGTAEPNSTVTVTVDGVVVGTTTADGTGAWTFTVVTPLADGAHTVNTTATDAAGNISSTSNTNTFTVDTATPTAPVVTAPTNGSSTNDTTPTYSGTAEPNSTVTVQVDGVVVGTATADGTGAWTFTVLTPLADGTHTVNTTATDAAGNVSANSNTNTFTVDTVAPTQPSITAPTDNATTTPTPAIAGTAPPNTTVSVLVDGVLIGTTPASATGAWSLTPTTALTAGAHVLTATASDAAGNTSTPSSAVTITVQATVPPTPTLTGPADGALTNNPTQTFSGTGTPNSLVTVTVDGVTACTAVVDSAGAFSCTATTPLANGPHLVTVSATNAVGTSPQSVPNRFTIDTTPPLTPVVVGPSDGSRTADSTPTLTGTGEPGSRLDVKIDGVTVGTTTIGADGTWSLVVTTPLSTGVHTTSVTATDAAGNVSLPSNTNRFTVDAATGAPTVTAPVDNATLSATTPSLSGAAQAGVTVSVRVDGVIVCTATADVTGAFSCTPSAPLTEGRHTLTATVSDGMGGSLTSNTNVFTIDTAAPAAPVVTSPVHNSTTADTSPTVAGTAEPFATVTITIDGMTVGTTTADASGAFSFQTPTALSMGTHTVSATATDRAGNASPASTTSTFTVGTVSGPTVLTPVDNSVTQDTTPTISGTGAPGSTIDARVDGQVVCTTTVAASGAWSCTPGTALGEGAHTASATQQGSPIASNTTAFEVDSVAPTAPVIVAPANGASTGPTPALSGTAEPGARVTVSVDGAAVCVTLADAQGQWSCVANAPLGDGAHSATATATDTAGNTSAASAPNTFSVDTVVPTAPTLVAPTNGSTVNTTQPELSGTAEPGTTVTVYVDGQAACTATAAAGGSFSCTPGSPLTTGSHSAQAVARDAAGNASTPSNTNTFTVEDRVPGAPTITAPASGSFTGDPTPTISGTAVPGSTVTVREGSLVVCTATVAADGTWSCDAAVLNDGSHTLTATATRAGLESPPSTPRSFTVDTAGPTTTVIRGPEPTTP
jgi:hypothetical protein